MADGYLKFDNQHVGNVIDEKKQITIRKGEPFVSTGEDVDLLTANGNKFGEGMILSVKELPAKEVVNINFEKHRNYSGFMDFAEEMQEYYDELIEPSTEFSVIYFKLKND